MHFFRKKAAISKHISNIFAVGELYPLATVSKMETVQIEGTRTIVRHVDYYNLDMILSIGYRVNSRSAIAFRQWANKVLKEYLVKGYAVRTNMQLQQYEELKQLVGVLQQTIQNEAGLIFSALFAVYEKAAMLLYLVTKNHSFSDGNKRIAATLFLWFMDRNGILYTPEGHKRIADNTLVALTLMIAESRTEEKDVMVKVVVNLINKKN